MKLKNGETIWEHIVNTYLDIKNFIYHNIFRKKKGNFKISNEYKLIFSDNFNTLNKNKWQTSQYYGRVFPSTDRAYYTADEACKFGKNGFESELYYKERDVKYWDGTRYHTLWDVGYLTSNIPYTYGIFEWNIVLPKREHIWGAIWLTGYDSWPPEIDVIEFYTDEKGKYHSSLMSNIHYNKEHYNIRQRRGLIFCEKNIYNTINLKLVYEKNHISFYMNDFKVRTILNKKVYADINDKRFYVVMNNGNDANFRTIDTHKKCTLYVKSFKYYKK